MSEKLCRLCFTKRLKRIGIFSINGVTQKIAEIIRIHFPDEITENDHLPQSVCLVCWAKLGYFHEFYKTVNEAKKNFILNVVEQEEQHAIEINCDSTGCNDDVLSVKLEPIPEIIVAEFEMPLLEDNEVDRQSTGEVEMAKHEDNTAGNVVTPSDTNEHFNDRDYSNDGNDLDSEDDDDASDYDSNPQKLDKAAVLEIIPREGAELDEITSSKMKGSTRTDKFDHLVCNYMDMKCEKCQHPFWTLLDASSHYQNKHQQRSVFLKCCQRRVNLPGEIRDHILYHLNPNAFKCSECEKTFTSQRQLKYHIPTHLRRQFECDICEKIFATRSSIRNHIMSKHAGVQEAEEHDCELCNKRFTLKNLLKHITHVHERRYEQVCHICAKTCPTKSLLVTHLKEHSDIKEPPLTCEYCGKSFKQPRNLRTHVRTMHEHDGKVHECPHCQKQYTKRRALKQHIAYHHNVKFHKCNVCEKEFKTSTNLKEHMTMHTGVNSYQCKYCPRTFRANGNMYTHLRRMHPNECKAAREAKLRNQTNALAIK